MKLSAREASGYFAKPDASKTGLLIYGPDAMRIALKRQQVIAALIGSKRRRGNAPYAYSSG